MSDWTRISNRDISGPISYKLEPHSYRRLCKKLPWNFCPKCGLITLRNPLTQWCMRMGCLYDSHPMFKSTARKLTQ